MSSKYFPNDYNFNDDQKRAYCELIKFIDAVKMGETIRFLLNGPGGTGKTYVMCKILERIKKMKLNYAVLAPTHKACGVIRETLEKEDVQTIAKFLGYQEEVDDEGNIIVKYNYRETKKKVDLLIIDESSMISKEQLDTLIGTGISIIFIGDVCQINPVKEDISGVFTMDLFGSVELTKNERVKDKELGATIINYRESVKKEHLLKKCIDNDHRLTSRTEFDKLLVDSILEGKETIYLAWTGSKVKEYNKYIREQLFGPEVKEYSIGEKMIFSQFYIGDYNKFHTSQIVTITKCEVVNMKFFFPRCICKGKRQVFEEYSNEENIKIDKCEKCNTPGSRHSYKEYKFWKINVSKNGTECQDIFYKPLNGMQDLYQILYKYRDRCKMSKNKFLWKEYYRLKEILDAPIEYSYAITVHKAQGSGYDNVFVDFDNINFCNNNMEKLRLLYTAVSRTKKKLYFIKE